MDLRRPWPSPCGGACPARPRRHENAPWRGRFHVWRRGSPPYRHRAHCPLASGDVSIKWLEAMSGLRLPLIGKFPSFQFCPLTFASFRAKK